MKKFIMVILTLTILCIGGVTVSANEAEYNTVGDLFQYWEQNDAYPDYVCGVWSTDGGMQNLTVAVLNTDEGNAGKQEILDLIRDDSTVTFEYGEHSYNMLREVQNSLEPFFKRDLGLVFSGIDVMKGRISLGILKDNKDNPDTVEMIEELKDKYGDLFVIEYTNHRFVYDLIQDIEDVTHYVKPTYDWEIALVCVLLFACVVGFVLRGRRIFVRQTNLGNTAESIPLTAKEVEILVRKGAVAVPPDLDVRVMTSIEKVK